jgi:hypothetical protein
VDSRYPRAAASNISSRVEHSQLEAQPFRCSEQTVLDRRFGSIEDFTHGSQLQALEMPQFKNHAFTWRQFLQSE